MKKYIKFSLDPPILRKSPFYVFRDNHVHNIMGILRKFRQNSQAKDNQKNLVSADRISNPSNPVIVPTSNMSGSVQAQIRQVMSILSSDPKILSLKSITQRQATRVISSNPRNTSFISLWFIIFSHETQNSPIFNEYDCLGKHKSAIFAQMGNPANSIWYFLRRKQHFSSF